MSEVHLVGGIHALFQVYSVDRVDSVVEVH